MNIYEQEMQRRKLAELMMQRSMTQRPSETGGGPYGRTVPVSPLEGISKIAQTIMASKMMDKSDDRLKQARADEEVKRQDAVENILKVYSGQKEEPYRLSPEEQFGAEQIPGLRTAGTAPDPERAIMESMGNPYTEKMGPVMAAMMKAKQPRAERSPFYKDIQQWNPETQRMETRILNARTGGVADIPGKRLSPKTPEAKAAQKSAETTAKLEAERTHGMAGLNEIVGEAELLLDYGDPTSSGIGAWVDWVNRQVGVTTKSAQDASKLEAIGAALTGKMPRFEGPQSDPDREYYMLMAGQIGNRKVPVAEKKRALEAVKALWGKYDKIAPKSKYKEIRKTPSGKILGMKEDGSIEVISEP